MSALSQGVGGTAMLGMLESTAKCDSGRDLMATSRVAKV
jgi:hypothetical protein